MACAAHAPTTKDNDLTETEDDIRENIDRSKLVRIPTPPHEHCFGLLGQAPALTYILLACAPNGNISTHIDLYSDSTSMRSRHRYSSLSSFLGGCVFVMTHFVSIILLVAGIAGLFLYSNILSPVITRS